MAPSSVSLPFVEISSNTRRPQTKCPSLKGTVILCVLGYLYGNDKASVSKKHKWWSPYMADFFPWSCVPEAFSNCPEMCWLFQFISISVQNWKYKTQLRKTSANITLAKCSINIVERSQTSHGWCQSHQHAQWGTGNEITALATWCNEKYCRVGLLAKVYAKLLDWTQFKGEMYIHVLQWSKKKKGRRGLLIKDKLFIKSAFHYFFLCSA